MTQYLIYWQVLVLRAMVVATVGTPGRSKIRQNLPAVAYRGKPLGISCCDGCNMPTVAPTIVRMATVGELEAEL
jgi:hypothetical protein